MADANAARPVTAPRVEAEPSARPATSPARAKPAPTKNKFFLALLERVFGPPPYRASIARIASAVTIPVFCWVFFTTSSGMIDIMRRESNDVIGMIGAFIGASAILVMLAATSMSLGADLGALIARRQFVGERVVLKTAITATIYVFVFSMSAFFSFTYYYTNIFKLSSKKIVSEMQPKELAADVILAGAKAIAANYDAETARINASPAMQNYFGAVDAMLRAASEQEPRFREGVQKIQEEISASAAAVAAKAAAELQDAQAAARLVEEISVKIAALNRAAGDLDSIISAKQAEIEVLNSKARQEDQLAVDAAKGLDGLGASCGPNCESHRAAAGSARKRIATIRQTLAGPQDERANAQKRRDALNAQLISLRQKAESAGASPAALAIAPAIPDFAATLRKLAELRTQISANPNWTLIRETKGYCGQILGTARRAGMALPGVQPDFDCEPSIGEARDMLTARDEVIAGRAAFEQKCALDGAIREQLQGISLRIRNAPESDKSAASNGFNEAKQIVDACVVSSKPAGLTEADVQALLKRSDDFSRSHTMDRNRFEMAREAFMSFTPDASMALGVAIAQDAFMFIMKLLSEIFSREVKTRERPPLPPAMDVADDEKDDPDMRMMKTLLRMSRPLHGDMSAFDVGAAGVQELPEHVRANLAGLLNRLVRERIAYIDRRGVYVLDNRTLASVEVRLAAAVERAKARRGDLFEPEGVRRDASGARLRRRGALQSYITARFRPAADDLPGETPAETEDRAAGGVA